jgi:hypothetical protein
VALAPFALPWLEPLVAAAEAGDPALARVCHFSAAAVPMAAVPTPGPLAWRVCVDSASLRELLSRAAVPPPPPPAALPPTELPPTVTVSGATAVVRADLSLDAVNGNRVLINTATGISTAAFVDSRALDSRLCARLLHSAREVAAGVAGVGALAGRAPQHATVYVSDSLYCTVFGDEVNGAAHDDVQQWRDQLGARMGTAADAAKAGAPYAHGSTHPPGCRWRWGCRRRRDNAGPCRGWCYAGGGRQRHDRRSRAERRRAAQPQTPSCAGRQRP